MSNKERLIENNEKIKEIRETLRRKQVSPTDMLQAIVDATNSCAYLFYNYIGDNLDIKNLDTSNVTRMDKMFNVCSNMYTVKHNLNTQNVTNMASMFNGCSKLISLDLSNFNTSNVTDMGYMFYTCKALTELDVSSFDTNGVTAMNYMFADCEKLTGLDLSNFDTSNVTTMYQMFYGCKALTELDLSNFDTGKVTKMGNMFYKCNNLTRLNVSNFDTSIVTDMSYMFADCEKLTELDLSSFDTHNVKYANQMFYDCDVLKNIIGKIDLYNATSTNQMFTSCYNLENVTLLNIKISLQLGSSAFSKNFGENITNATLINTIQQLWDLTGGKSQTLTLSTASKENIANIYVKLVDVTDEMLATDPYASNKKPCVVCEPTDEGAMTLIEYATTQKNWAIA